MVLAIRCHRQNMKTSIINGSEVSRLSVAIQTVQMVEFVLPYLIADERKEKSLMIYNYPAVDCYHSFVFNIETGTYGIATDRFMSRQETMEFPSLEFALRHLQANTLIDDVDKRKSLNDEVTE
ncbi:hypothetical protein CITSP_04922 [Citrobacter sp. T1.2D-1]|nr:hypothetical protein CITSP_04922 [Citrobacter sp. T1.2D-1]